MKNWAYIVTIPDVGAISYGKAYFEKANIVNPLTAAPYTDEEIKAIVNGVSEGANDYTFDLPENALLGRGGFWYDETAAAAITGHADPLTMNEEGVILHSGRNGGCFTDCSVRRAEWIPAEQPAGT